MFWKHCVNATDSFIPLFHGSVKLMGANGAGFTAETAPPLQSGQSVAQFPANFPAPATPFPPRPALAVQVLPTATPSTYPPTFYRHAKHVLSGLLHIFRADPQIVMQLCPLGVDSPNRWISNSIIKLPGLKTPFLRLEYCLKSFPGLPSLSGGVKSEYRNTASVDYLYLSR